MVYDGGRIVQGNKHFIEEACDLPPGGGEGGEGVREGEGDYISKKKDDE